MRTGSFVFLVLALLSSGIVVADAAEKAACPNREAIISLSDIVLRDLLTKDASFAELNAADAAYLKLHYQSLDEHSIDGMMGWLLRNGAYGNASFVYAYYVSRLGYDRATQIINKSIPDYFRSHPLTGDIARELGRAGRFDLVVASLREPMWKHDYDVVGPIALSFIDYPVEERRKMAKLADAAGIPLLAGGLYASLPDYVDWPGFLKRHVEGVGFEKMRWNYIFMSGYVRENPPLPDPHNSSNRKMYRQFIQTVVANAWLAPQPGLLLDYTIRYKFEPLYSHRAARVLNALHDRGLLRPEDPMAKGWLATLQALAKVTDNPSDVISKMQKVFVPSRHYLQTNAGYILDTMLASETIGPWLKDETSVFPAPPVLASTDLVAHWADWRIAAEAVKSNARPASVEEDVAKLGMTADLLFAKGDAEQLTSFVSGVKSPVYRQRLAADFMARYDRLCDASLYYPGDALFMNRWTIHRFPAK